MLRALKNYDNVSIVIGSANQPRTIKNPWTADERQNVILDWYDKELVKDSTLGKLTFVYQRDWKYNNSKWFSDIHGKLQNESDRIDLSTQQFKHDPIWITGSKRDPSSFYLDGFPRPVFELDLVPIDEQVSATLSATWCREIYLGRSFNGRRLDRFMYESLMAAVVPETTMKWLNEFEKTDAFKYLTEAYAVIQDRQREMMTKYGVAPAICADAVVIQSGHILLIRRRSHPGKGLWALPGGHVDAHEFPFDAAIRELGEESKIDCPPAVIRGSLKFSQWFDHPDRSNVSRVITHAFCFHLPDYKINGRVTLPTVRGSDDADRARWFPIYAARDMASELFDDHHEIIEAFVHKLGEK